MFSCSRRKRFKLTHAVETVNGENVLEKDYKYVLNLLRDTSRPLTVTFARDMYGPPLDITCKEIDFTKKSPRKTLFPEKNEKKEEQEEVEEEEKEERVGEGSNQKEKEEEDQQEVEEEKMRKKQQEVDEEKDEEEEQQVVEEEEEEKEEQVGEGTNQKDVKRPEWLPNGWTMVQIPRKATNNKVSDKYYFAPDGKKCRSRPEVERYLKKINKTSTGHNNRIVEDEEEEKLLDYGDMTVRPETLGKLIESPSTSSKQKKTPKGHQKVHPKIAPNLYLRPQKRKVNESIPQTPPPPPHLKRRRRERK